jgi:hypothetical protein
MSKWIRIDNQNTIQEVIDYDPNGVVNETFLPLFKGPFSDDVMLGYVYDPDTDTCTLPDNHGLNPEGDRYVPIPEGCSVDENGYIVYPEPDPSTLPPASEPEPQPKYITVSQFRAQLTLQEKLIWDNPQNATPEQSSSINTVSADFPQRVDGTEFLEELDLLESVGVIGTGRAQELLTYFSEN